MANPNIVNVTTIYGTTTYYTPTGTTAVVLLANTASSGKVYKINQIVAANTTTSAANASVSIYTNGAVPVAKVEVMAPDAETVVKLPASGVDVPMMTLLI